MQMTCERCGSDRIVPMANIQDQGQYSDGQLKAVVFKNPEAWLFKGAVVAKLKAQICADCGHTELIAENAAELYEAYQAAHAPIRRMNYQRMTLLEEGADSRLESDPPPDADQTK